MRPNCSPMSKSFRPRDRRRPPSTFGFRQQQASASSKARADYRSVCYARRCRDEANGRWRQVSRGSAIGKAVEICDGPVRVIGLDPRAIVRGRLEPVALGDASRERASRRERSQSSRVTMLRRTAVHDLLTDAPLAARWQLSRGTLANQRSQGRGPAYLKLAGRTDTDSRISKPTNRTDSCRGNQPEPHPLVTRVTCGRP